MSQEQPSTTPLVLATTTQHHECCCSAIRDSQQRISPIGFLFLKLPPPPRAVLLVCKIELQDQRISKVSTRMLQRHHAVFLYSSNLQALSESRNLLLLRQAVAGGWCHSEFKEEGLVMKDTVNLCYIYILYIYIFKLR